MAEAIAANAPTALMLTKRLGYLGLTSELDTARHFETFAQDYAYGRRDFREAVAARNERRTPSFTGE